MATTTTKMTEYQLLVTALRTAGYERGVPGHVTAQALAADEEVLAELLCPSCGRSGPSLERWRRGAAWRTVAVCPCGECVEM